MNAVKELVEGYLHPNYLELYGDPWTAVEDFARNADEDSTTIRADINTLLARNSSERRLRKIVTGEYGSAYKPDADGMSYEAWLNAVADRVDLVRASPELMALEGIPRTYIPITGETTLKGASTFPDLEMAEEVAATILETNSELLSRWLGGHSSGLRLTGTFDDPVGQLLLAGTGEAVEVNDAVAVLRRSDALGIGYVIKAVYPTFLDDAVAAPTDLDGLAQFIGVYLYQDWADDYRTMWAAVDAFVAEDRDLAQRLPADVTRLLSTVTSEEALRVIVLGTFDSWYVVEPDGWTYRNWLLAVGQRIERAMLTS
jgi:hypothetical protein